MLKLIRCAIKSVTGRLFTASGYIGQELKGELWQHYGFTSHPREGSKGVALTLPNGSFLIATADESRTVEIDDGEVCLHTSAGCKIHLKKDDSIEITADKVVVKSEKIELGSGALEKMIKGETFMQLFNAHIHNYDGANETTAPLTLMTEILNLSKEVKNA
jgi:phage gp45-like